MEIRGSLRLEELAAEIFAPAVEKAGLARSRPYDVRHSFCSLLLVERQSVIEIARQLGHPPSMTL